MENVDVLLGSAEVVKFKGEGTAIEVAANALVVVDEAGRAQASDMRERARQFKKAVQARFESPKEAAHKAHTEICALEKDMFGPADRVIKITEGKMSAYQLEEDRKHQEEQAKIDADTKRKEDAEKERLLKLAVKQAESGNEEKAEATLQRAEEVAYVAPVLPSIDKRVVTEAGGTSSRKDFDITVVEPAAVFAAVVRGALPPAVLEIKMGPLKKYAEMNRVGDTLPVIPGCRLVAKFTYSGRAK
jgi:hypothetical protein